MVYFFTILTHVLIILGILGIFYFIGYLIISVKDTVERILRTSALTTGFLIYYGSKLVGLSIPSFMIKAISTLNPFTIGFFGIIFPGFIGTIVAWYCVKNINKHEDVAARTVILITTFIVVLFGDVYSVTFQFGHGYINEILLPNLTFTIGLCLYLIFKYKR